MRVVVLGCGLVGGPMALDLAKDRDFVVKVADLNSDSLSRMASRAPIESLLADLSDPAQVHHAVDGADLVLSAVPGKLGFQTLRAVIEARKNVVDIAFFPEDPFELDGLAMESGVTAIVDCGVMPGMGSVLAASAAAQMEFVEDVQIYVGGLPVVREWPFEYKAVFSPADVIEEYVRPARFVENGQIVTRPALSEPELLSFPGIGTLEAFNTDGLRTMLTTVKSRNMREKTLRYPGHIEKVATLKKLGFFAEEKVEVDGVQVSPLSLTSKLLFSEWRLEEGDADLTVMAIQVSGIKDGRQTTFRWDLLDHFDREEGVPSMARTTGYTATAAIRMLREGLYRHRGVSPPEFLGKSPECVSFLLGCLEERGVRYRASRPN